MDRTTQEEIKAHLMQTNERFREMLSRHLEYDRMAAELDGRPTLTPEEEVEEHRLKKLKLHLKDEMEQMVNEYSFQHAAAS